MYKKTKHDFPVDRLIVTGKWKMTKKYSLPEIVLY